MNKKCIFKNIIFLFFMIQFFRLSSISVNPETQILDRQVLNTFWASGVCVVLICFSNNNTLSLLVLQKCKEWLSKTTNTVIPVKIFGLDVDQGVIQNINADNQSLFAFSALGIDLLDSEKKVSQVICFKNGIKFYSQNLDASFCLNKNQFSKFWKNILATNVLPRSIENEKNKAAILHNKFVKIAELAKKNNFSR